MTTYQAFVLGVLAGIFAREAARFASDVELRLMRLEFGSLMRRSAPKADPAPKPTEG